MLPKNKNKVLGIILLVIIGLLIITLIALTIFGGNPMLMLAIVIILTIMPALFYVIKIFTMNRLAKKEVEDLAAEQTAEAEDKK